jgi:hypothetical protein
MISKIPKMTFYYVLPTVMGFSAGLVYRDYYSFDISKKISVSLAEYYEFIEDKPDSKTLKEYPELNKLMRKIDSK